MTKIGYKITIEAVWLRENTKLDKCLFCKETIYSNAYRLNLMAFTETGSSSRIANGCTETQYCLCESCNQAMNNNEAY